MKTIYCLLLLLLSCSVSAGLPTPIAHFELDGDAKDTQGNLSDGLIYNAVPAPDRWGVPNKAMYFNGTNAYIRISDQGILAQKNIGTYCFWAKVGEKSSGYSVFVSKYRADTPNEEGYLTSVNSGQLRAWMKGALPIEKASPIDFYEFDSWNHYCSIRHNDQVMHYVNGYLYDVYGLDTISSPSTPADLLIGAVHTATGSVSWYSYALATIDDVVFYTEQLSPQQIRSLTFKPKEYPTE